MENGHEKIWNDCLTVIKDNVPPVSFRTWFVPIKPLNLENEILTLQVPSQFFFEYLEEHFIDILRKTLRRVLGKNAKLEYSILLQEATFNNPKPLTVKYPEKGYGVKNQSMAFHSDNHVIKNPFIIPGIQKLQVNPQLNPNYSFNNFIEGECNRLARAAGMSIAQSPGQTPFNPLFVYGESGLGKTHLAHAIGLEIKQKYTEKVVLYVAANRFQTQYSDAAIQNNINDFLHFYQMIDVLIIDDVQQFAGKQKTQDTFFHIFNHLHQSGKQLIMTSDKPPAELQGMEKRLLSRFKWGLSAELQLPDYETRMSILRHKIYNDGIELTDEVVEYIATNVITSVRELEGTLISLLAQATHNKRDITIDLVKKTVEKLVKRHKPEVSIDYIQKIVCDYFNMNLDVLQSKSRKREVVQARQIAMFFSKKLTKSSLAVIGAQIGGKDHATVLHACRTVDNLTDTDKRFKRYVDDISKKLVV